MSFSVGPLLIAVGLAAAAPSSAPPSVTESRRHMLRGKAAMKSAKTPEDFVVAAKEFEAAAAANPKLAEASYNAGVAYEKAGDPASAIARFNAYLAAAPKAKDAPSVRDRVIELEFLAEKAADASGCWRAPDFKPLPDGTNMSDPEYCGFVVERLPDGRHMVRVWREIVAMGQDHERLTLLSQVVEGRRFRFTIASAVVTRHGEVKSTLEYDLNLTPDGKRFKGTLHEVTRFFKRDTTIPVEFARREG